jgi:hypothetical protein
MKKLKCGKCEVNKNQKEFAKCDSSFRGYDYYCKDCRKEYIKKYMKEYREKIKTKNKERK